MPVTPGPGPALAPSTGRVVARLARQVDQALGDAGLSMPQYRVLCFLDEVDGAAASAVAGRLQVTRPSVTALVDGLVTRGLVERRPSTTDRRSVEHHLTADGRHALDAGDLAVQRRLGELAAPLSDAARTDARAGLEAWGAALDHARQAFLAAR
jgi:long-chain acyl-CoA synthetase